MTQFRNPIFRSLVGEVIELNVIHLYSGGAKSTCCWAYPKACHQIMYSTSIVIHWRAWWRAYSGCATAWLCNMKDQKLRRLQKILDIAQPITGRDLQEALPQNGS